MGERLTWDRDDLAPLDRQLGGASFEAYNFSQSTRLYVKVPVCWNFPFRRDQISTVNTLPMCLLILSVRKIRVLTMKRPFYDFWIISKETKRTYNQKNLIFFQNENSRLYTRWLKTEEILEQKRIKNYKHSSDVDEDKRLQSVPEHRCVPFYFCAQKSRAYRYHLRSRFSCTQASSALTNLTTSVYSSAQWIPVVVDGIFRGDRQYSR